MWNEYGLLMLFGITHIAANGPWRTLCTDDDGDDRYTKYIVILNKYKQACAEQLWRV